MKRRKTGKPLAKTAYGTLPGEAAVAQRIRELWAQGRGCAAIARDLVALGVKTRRGGQWHPLAVKRASVDLGLVTRAELAKQIFWRAFVTGPKPNTISRINTTIST
jgi:Recombinase